MRQTDSACVHLSTKFKTHLSKSTHRYHQSRNTPLSSSYAQTHAPSEARQSNFEPSAEDRLSVCPLGLQGLHNTSYHSGCKWQHLCRSLDPTIASVTLDGFTFDMRPSPIGIDHHRRASTTNDICPPPPGTHGSASQFQHRTGRGNINSRMGPSGHGPGAVTNETHRRMRCSAGRSEVTLSRL